MTASAIRQLKKLLDDRNLKVCALGFQTRSGYGVADRLQERIDATKQVMTLAYELGANLVVNQIGQIPDDEPSEAWSMMRDVMVELGRHAHHCGAFFAAETGSESGASLAKFIGQLPEGTIGVAFNPGKLVINQFSPTEAIHDLGRHVMYVHAQDGVRDRAQGRGIEVALGRGSVDFPTLIGTLGEFGYRGYYTVQRISTDLTASDIAQAIQYLKNL
jgi:sugar phosphate isomerase/epimerase